MNLGAPSFRALCGRVGNHEDDPWILTRQMFPNQPVDKRHQVLSGSWQDERRICLVPIELEAG